jgi:hypothetical protein
MGTDYQKINALKEWVISGGGFIKKIDVVQYSSNTRGLEATS